MQTANQIYFFVNLFQGKFLESQFLGTHTLNVLTTKKVENIYKKKKLIGKPADQVQEIK